MKELVEVYEVAPGANRPGFGYKPGCIAVLSPDEPLPSVGDILILPRTMTNDTKEQAYYWGLAAPFRVVDREHMYESAPDTGDDGAPVRRRKTWIHIRRISEEEYARAPGQSAKQ